MKLTFIVKQHFQIVTSFLTFAFHKVV